MNIIIILGPPGSGKGTYSEALAKRHGFTHISSGELLRERARIDDVLGREVKYWMDQNVLLADEIVSKVVEDHLRQLPPDQTIILDGFPRKMDNYRSLHSMTMKHGWNIKSVAAIDVSEKVCTDRILGRGRNKLDKDPKEVAKRFEDYRTETVPVIEEYEAQGKLTYIDGDGTIEECVLRAEKALGLPNTQPESTTMPKPRT